MARLSLLPLFAFAVACGDTNAPAGAMSSRDSAGIAIVEYPADAIETAPVWQVSQEPLATIGRGRE